MPLLFAGRIRRDREIVGSGGLRSLATGANDQSGKYQSMEKGFLHGKDSLLNRTCKSVSGACRQGQYGNYLISDLSSLKL